MTIEEMRRTNMWRLKLEYDYFKHPIYCCPFCGSTSVSAVHSQEKFIGMNGHYTRKIAMKCYCTCNKCHARSKAVKYIGYVDAPPAFYDSEHQHIYSDDMKLKALEEWNKRYM